MLLCPAASTSELLILTINEADLGTISNTLIHNILIYLLGAVLKAVGEAVRDNEVLYATLPVKEVVQHRMLGDILYKALFTEPIRSRFGENLGLVRGQSGLRIKLHIDPSLAWLASLPLKLLRQKQTFLGLSRLTPIVRYMDAPLAPAPRPIEKPLRIHVLAQPLYEKNSGERVEPPTPCAPRCKALSPI